MNEDYVRVPQISTSSKIGPLCVVGSWVIVLILGAQIAWGNMSTYICSYFYHYGNDIEGATMAKFYVVQPLIVFTSLFFFPIGMHISAQYNPKLVLAVSGLITFSSVWISSCTLNPQVFIYLYGLGFGVGKGLFYSTALQSGISHYPERKGMVAGLVVCGFGFGGFTWGLLARYLCNPDDLKPYL